jgi:Bacterial capsule synthesis protein PGA_cap
MAHRSAHTRGPRAIGLLAVLAAMGALAAPPSYPAQALGLRAPALVARGTAIPVEGVGAAAGEHVLIEIAVKGHWRRLASARADASGRFERDVKPLRSVRSYLLRARTTTAVSQPTRVRSRAVTLTAVGDVNLGDGPAAAMGLFGLRYPWTGTARTLRAADVAFANLECSVSTRGAPVPKEFNFRGAPAALRVMARYAGFDVVNLANNHTGDYGTAALLDTVKNVRRFGMQGVGAGGSLASAAQPRLLMRLGLRIAFVGFSDILPSSFFAAPDHAGTQPARSELIAAGMRRARKRADVVIATFHWGVERAPRESARQRAFAQTALRAGADAVIGAHPHVLQPIERRGRTLVAYSLGNFVFGAGSPGTTRTGILRLRLSARGVEGSRLVPAVIENSRPRLLGR